MHYIYSLYFTCYLIEDMLLFGNNLMLKKYNVTIQRVLFYTLNKTQTVCNTTMFNRKFKNKFVCRCSVAVI